MKNKKSVVSCILKEREDKNFSTSWSTQFQEWSNMRQPDKRFLNYLKISQSLWIISRRSPTLMLEGSGLRNPKFPVSKQFLKRSLDFYPLKEPIKENLPIDLSHWNGSSRPFLYSKYKNLDILGSSGNISYFLKTLFRGSFRSVFFLHFTSNEGSKYDGEKVSLREEGEKALSSSLFSQRLSHLVDWQFLEGCLA